MKSFRALRLLLIVSSLGVLGALVVHLGLRPNPWLADNEQYAVLSAYIEPNPTGYSHDLGNGDDVIVIAARTGFSKAMISSNKFQQYRSLVLSTCHSKPMIHKLGWSLVFEFWVANLRDITIERKLRLRARYELATDEEMRSFPSAAFLEHFPSSYGAITFSRIAFNRDLTEAFFYTEHLCGLCGAGKFVHMRKLGGKWVVDDTALTWVS